MKPLQLKENKTYDPNKHQMQMKWLKSTMLESQIKSIMKYAQSKHYENSSYHESMWSGGS